MGEALVTSNDQNEHYCCSHDGKSSITGTYDFILSHMHMNQPSLLCSLAFK